MASAKEIKKHLNIALREVGEIKPRFIKQFNAWKFCHKKYPDVEYFGDSPEDVIKNYPQYLQEFIKHRLAENIWESVEKKTKGRGGKREGAGRPKGSKKSPTRRISLPKDIADWIELPSTIPQLRQLMAKGRHSRNHILII
jgi:hypothetical protein